jgi:hypothetical protein
MSLALTLPDEIMDGLSPGQRIALWAKAGDAYEDLLITAIQMKIGPDRDWKPEYRRIRAVEMEEHSRMLVHMLQELGQRERRANQDEHASDKLSL